MSTIVAKDMVSALTRPRVLKVQAHSSAAPATTPPFAPIHGFVSTGFPLTYAELMHAVGCKIANLPMSEKEECRKSAYYLAHLLCLGGAEIRFKSHPDSDMVTSISQTVGAGMVCLLAHKGWQIPFDRMEPIPGRGKRFDYRARTDLYAFRFEAKGTRHSGNQAKQVTNGLKKKAVERASGVVVDVHLVVGTLISQRASLASTMLVADPSKEIDPWVYSPEGDEYFRLRHHARVCNYAGLPGLGVKLKRMADELHKMRVEFAVFGSRRYHEPDPLAGAVPNIRRVKIDGVHYLGRDVAWSTSEDLTPQHPRNAAFGPGPGFVLFQGVSEQVVASLLKSLSGGPMPSDSEGDARTIRSLPWPGGTATVFPDGSILGITSAKPR